MQSLTYPAPIPPGTLVRPLPVSEIDPATLALYIPQKLSAGFPSPVADYVEQKLDCNRYLVDRVASTFIFDVKGWSMKLAGIFDGDKVLVDRSIPPLHGHIVVAISETQEHEKPYLLAIPRATCRVVSMNCRRKEHVTVFQRKRGKIDRKPTPYMINRATIGHF